MTAFTLCDLIETITEWKRSMGVWDFASWMDIST